MAANREAKARVEMSHADLRGARMSWPGVRRAGRPTAEPGADAGPAALKAPTARLPAPANKRPPATIKHRRLWEPPPIFTPERASTQGYQGQQQPWNVGLILDAKDGQRVVWPDQAACARTGLDPRAS